MADTQVSATPDAPIDIVSAIREAASSARVGIDSAVGQMNSAIGIGSTAVRDANTAATKSAEAQTEINNNEAASKEKLSLTNAESASALSNMPGAASKWLSEVGSTLLPKEKDAMALQDSLISRSQVKFMDDPFQYIWNQGVAIPQEQKSLELTEHAIDQRTGTIQKVQTLTTDAYKNNAAVAAVDAATNVSAINEKALQDAKKEVADNTFKLASLGITAASLRNQTSMEGFSLALGVNNAVATQFNLALDVTKVDLEKRAQQVREDSQRLIQGEKTRNDTERAQFEADLITASAKAGVSVTSVLQYDKSDAKTKSALTRIIATSKQFPGMDPNASPVANTPAEALSIWSDLGTLGGSPGQAALNSKLNEWKSAVTENPMFNMNTKPETRLAMENDEIKKRAETEYKSIPTEGGIYSPPPLVSALSMPILKTMNLPIVERMKLFSDANPQYKTDPNDFLATGAKMIAEGKGTPESVAGQISSVFKIIAGQNNETKLYSRSALKSLNVDKYPMQGVYIGSGSTFGGAKISTVNMADPVALRNILTRRAISERVMQEQSKVQPGGTP